MCPWKGLSAKQTGVREARQVAQRLEGAGFGVYPNNKGLPEPVEGPKHQALSDRKSPGSG